MSNKRVFVSYSWSSEHHVDWVVELAQQLMANGIDVELDKWSTVEGQDLNVFMEKMVNDPTIDRVLIISDESYTRKANERKGGVGTESQIISPQIYQSVDQKKFIPIVRERDGEGKVFLPTFLTSRKYFDFSNDDEFSLSLELLIRNIFDKPLAAKPIIGRPPAYLNDSVNPTYKCATAANRCIQIVDSGKSNLRPHFENFLEDFIEDLSCINPDFPKDDQNRWCEVIKSSIGQTLPLRDLMMNVFKKVIPALPDEDLFTLLQELLERMMPIIDARKFNQINYRGQKDHHRFFCYELFLYLFALLNRSKRYGVIRAIFDGRYSYLEELDGHSDWKPAGYDYMNTHTELLDSHCSEQAKRLSLVADLLFNRATRVDIKFHELLQADAICWLEGLVHKSSYKWFPRSLVYANKVGTLELFARSTNRIGFAPIQTILAIEPTLLVKYLESDKAHEILHGREMWRSMDTERFFNLSTLRGIT